MEKWQPVTGFEAEYEVSDLGRVRSLARKVANGPKSMRSLPAQFIAPYFRKEGYATVRLSRQRKKVGYYVHRLVAAAFLGEGPCGTEVCHRNGDKSDNHISNLYWGTRLENMADRQRLKEMAKGERHGMAKLTDAQVKAIIADSRFHKDIADDYSVSRGLISMIKRGRIWCHLHG